MVQSRRYLPVLFFSFHPRIAEWIHRRIEQKAELFELDLVLSQSAFLKATTEKHYSAVVCLGNAFFSPVMELFLESQTCNRPTPVFYVRLPMGRSLASSRACDSLCAQIRTSDYKRLPAEIAQAILRVKINDSFENLTSASDLAEYVKTTEKKLFEATHLLGQIIDNVPLGIYWKDTSLRITGCNKAMADYFCVPVEQVLSKRLGDFIDSKQASLLETVEKTVLQKKRKAGQAYEWINPQKRQITSLCKIPLFGQDGEVCGVLTMAKDVTEVRRNEAEFLRSKERLEEAQKIAHIGSWYYDVASGEAEWTDEIFRIFGLPVGSKASSELFLQCVHPEDRDEVQKHLKQGAEEREIWKGICRILRPDGSIRYICRTGKKHCDENGKPVCVIGTIQDVTEQILAEQETRQYAELERMMLIWAENLFNKPIGELDDAIEWSLQMVGTFSGADRVSVHEYNKESGMSVAQYEWAREDRFSTKNTLPLVELSKIDSFVSVLRGGHEYVRDDPSELNVEESLYKIIVDSRSNSALVYPMMIEDELWGALTLISEEKKKKWPDKLRSIIKIYSEVLISVIRRKKREAALQQSSEINRLLLESSADGIVLLGLDGVILSVNNTFVQHVQKPIDQIIGSTIYELIPQEQDREVIFYRDKMLRIVIQSGKPVTFEDSRDGRWYLHRYYPVKEGGNMKAVSLFFTDVTAQKKMDQEIFKREQSQAKLKVLTEFFTNVSHEFKTPLSVILMQLELMKLYLNDQDALLGFIRAATQNSYRLSRLVGNILDLSKLDAGFMNVRYEMADVVSLVHELCQSVQAYAKAKGVQLCSLFDARHCVMPVDSVKLERILLNLLSNAIKHTPHGGYIEVRMQTKQDGITIAVEDTGEGIPPEKQQGVFDRFVTVDTSIARNKEGSGIGLALVKSMVDLLQGTVTFTSELNKGSTFVVWLPRLEPEVCQRNIQTEGFELREKAAMEFSDLFYIDDKEAQH